MKAWLSEEITPVQTGALLAGLRAKSASGIELSSMAEILLANYKEQEKTFLLSSQQVVP